MVRLGDVCTFYSGTGFPNIYQGKADGKYPFYKVGDISRNVLSGNRELKICENYIDDDTATKIKGTLLPPQTVVFAKIGEALRLNRRAITSRDCLVDNNAMGIKSDDSIIDSLYFYYFMCNVDLQNYCESTTVPSVRKTRIAEIEIPLPPLDEQRRIAAVLDKVSGLIAKRREQLDKLDELVKARFVEMFGDPVLNPMDWPTYHLADMADIVSGITKGRKTKEQNLIEVPYMAVSNVKDGHIDWTTIKTILATQSEIDQYRLLPDDVLMTEGGDPDKLGRGAIIQKPLENCIHQNHIFRVRLNENVILPVYFAEFLQHQKAKQYFLRCAKQTTGIASINMTQLKELPTLVPPRALQKDFTNTVERINKSKLTIQQSLDKLEVLKKALIQQYFGRGDEGVLYKLKAFQAGEYFHQASANIIPDDWLEDDDSGWFVPSIVNMAFACELYLKSLLSNGTSKICGHNLYKLYKKLPDKIKTYLQSNTSGYADDTSFEDVLKKNATVFEDWRYYFEEKPYLGVSVLFLESLANVLHSAAEKECK